MKELSIEEKAKAYDEAIQRAGQFMETPYLENSDDVVGFIFPELKESEDERIRKALIEAFSRPPGHNCVNVFNGIPHRKIVTWLEKKGEQNLAFIEKGKWYVCIRTSYKPNGKDFIEGKIYYAKEDYKIIGECGEVDIATDNPEEFFRSATEEETNDIIKNFVNEQKPVEWSEEDKDIIVSLVSFLENELSSSQTNEDRKLFKRQIEIVKSIHPQPQQKWSEEDERIFESVLWHLRNSVNNGDADHSAGQLEIWLKSLKDRYTWKPSDEQMKALTFACVKNVGIDKSSIKALYDLKEQLKQL